MKVFNKGDYVSVLIQSHVIFPVYLYSKYDGKRVVGRIQEDWAPQGSWTYIAIDAEESIGLRLNAHVSDIELITEEEYFKQLLARPWRHNKEEEL